MKNLDAPEDIFKKVLELSASIDKDGNAIIESEGLNSGLCVKGVVCQGQWVQRELSSRMPTRSDLHYR